MMSRLKVSGGLTHEVLWWLVTPRLGVMKGARLAGGQGELGGGA